MTARPVGSVGLGGWLWPVTLLGPTLAVLAAALCVYGMRGIVVDLAPRVSHWPATFQVDGWFGSLAFAVLSAIAGTWSARWFDRDPVVPRRGPWVLAALAVGLSLLAWDTGDSILSPLLVAFAWLVALAAFLAARVSRRVHNTFTGAPLAPRASGWRGVLMHGPADWSNGRWWRVGVFGAATAMIVHDLMVLVPLALTTIPPLRLPPGATEVERILAEMSHPGDLIRDARLALVPMGAATLALLAALFAQWRGVEWARWALLAAIALGASRGLLVLLPGLVWRDLWWGLLVAAAFGGAFQHWPPSPRGGAWAPGAKWLYATAPVALLLMALGMLVSVVHGVRSGAWAALHDGEQSGVALEVGVVVVLTCVAWYWASRWFHRRTPAWASRRWLVPAVLVVATPSIWEMTVLLDAWRAVGPPDGPRPVADGTSNAALLPWAVWDQVALARALTPVILLGIVLHIASFAGVLRRARWVPTTAILALLAPLTVGAFTDASHCCGLVLGDAAPSPLRMLLTLLVLALVGGVRWHREGEHARSAAT